MIRSTRRDFLRAASLAAAVLPVQRTRFGATTLYIPSVSGASQEPDFYTLTERAIDAARSAGATYADARITLTRSQSLPWIIEEETRAFGVRVLVNGYWGFVASAVWTPDEAVRLAREAVVQANARRGGRSRVVDLGRAPVVQRGEWTTPIKYDPFDIPIVEKLDVMAALADLASTTRVGIGAQAGMNFTRQSRVFASSDGASWRQTIYTSDAQFMVSYRNEYHAGLPFANASADFLSSAGRGWELVTDSGIAEAIPQLIEDAEQARHRVPVDVGRYDMVMSAETMAALLDHTLGAATELDRALGYEANASGTSYLDDPLQFLGAGPIVSPKITVAANRSLPGGAATVRWDDEGVVPGDFVLIDKGVLVDYQTTREQAAWLAPYYQRAGRPMQSHGCAAAGSALDITMQHAPNLALQPGSDHVTFDSLVAATEKGVAVLDLDISMDQQQLNGMASGTMREISRGKLGRYLHGGTLVFRAPELWKNIVALGGPGTQRWFGHARGKGQPRQRTVHSVGAVPAKIPQLSLIDRTRKA